MADWKISVPSEIYIKGLPIHHECTHKGPARKNGQAPILIY